MGSTSDGNVYGYLSYGDYDFTITRGSYTNYLKSMRIIYGDIPTFSQLTDAATYMANLNNNLNTTQWKIEYTDGDGDFLVILENTTDYGDMFNGKVWITFHI